MSKGTTILSDLRGFFSENENNRALNNIMSVMEHINIRPNQIGAGKEANCKFTSLQVFNLLILFPFFAVKNAARHRAQRLTAQPVMLQPRLPRALHALHDGPHAIGQPRVAVVVGDVRA